MPSQLFPSLSRKELGLQGTIAAVAPRNCASDNDEIDLLMLFFTSTNLLGKLKSMTRLEKAKWLKRAKKELVKRFGTTLDGDADSDKV